MNTSERYILGIDPGLRITGYGVILNLGAQYTYIASGTVCPETTQTLPERIATLFNDLSVIIRQYQPQQAAIEKVFSNVNPQATLLLGQARGAALAALTSQQLNVAEYTALQVKQAVVGHGKASKPQVQEMVGRLLGMPALASIDASDALACAICHVHSTTNSLASLTHHSYRLRRQRTNRLRLSHKHLAS